MDTIELEGQPGLPRAERVKKLAALDAEIAKLEAALDELHKEAAAAGVVLRNASGDQDGARG